MRPIWVHVDDDMHEKVLIAARKKNIGMSTYIRELLKKDLKTKRVVLSRPFLTKNVKYIGGSNNRGMLT